ncbi:MAG: hypothetical protein NTX64_01970 [Elusimicrobia bacterium]|nr:hypothetical protein [Elusimicrobiota bacterium]
MSRENRFRAWAFLGAGAMFALFWVRPLLMRHWRAREARLDPAAWSRVETNGSFALLGLHAFPTRYVDETFYANKMQVILKHGFPYNPHWREDRTFGSWFSSDFLSLYLLAPLIWLAGDLNWGWVLAEALVGAAWFLFLFRLLRDWCGKEEAAAPLAAAGVLFFDAAIWLLDVNRDWRLDASRWLSVFLYRGSLVLPHYYRLPALFMATLLLCLTLVAAWRLSVSGRRPWAAVMTGLAFGLMRGVHSFEYAAGMATLGFFAAASTWLKPRREGAANLWLAFGAAVAVTVAWLGVEHLAVGTKALGDTLARVCLERTHRFYPQSLLHVAVAVVALWLGRREADARRQAAWSILACGELGVFALRNAQVVLGYTTQPFHLIPVGGLFAVLMLLMLVSRALARMPRWNGSAALAAILALACWGVAREVQGARRGYRFFGIPRDTDAALAYVRENLPNDALVLSLSMPANLYLPLYTRASVLSFPQPNPFLSAPHPYSVYLGKTAQLLKSAGVDASRFVAERWLDGPALESMSLRLDREVNQEGRADLDLVDKSWWSDLSGCRNVDADPVSEQKLRFLELVRSAEPVSGQWYLWLEDRDRPLLDAAPEKRGGRLLWRQGLVSLYSFGG